MRYKTKKNYWQQDIRKYEYLFAILQGVGLILAISYLFYGTVWGALILSPYLIRYLKSWKKQKVQKKKQCFQVQFKEAITSMSAALRVGYSSENALREAYKDMQLLYKKNEPIVRELQYMVHQLEMNVPAQTVLSQFAERTGEEDVEAFSTVFAMTKRSGGDLIAMIQNAVTQIGEKQDVKREIETVISAKKLEFRLMCAIPFAMIAYLKLGFPEFTGVLYGNLPGIGIMTACLGLYWGSYELGKRIVEIEV